MTTSLIAAFVHYSVIVPSYACFLSMFFMLGSYIKTFSADLNDTILYKIKELILSLNTEKYFALPIILYTFFLIGYETKFCENRIAFSIFSFDEVMDVTV